MCGGRKTAPLFCPMRRKGSQEPESPAKRRDRLGALQLVPWHRGDEAVSRREWGVPLHDDQKQFEFICLEVLQCGLNWDMMIRKRQIFRRCFEGFDPARVAAYGEAEIERILSTEGMIRSRRKVEAIIGNARCLLALQREHGSFSAWLWGLAGGAPILYAGHQRGGLPSQNGLSRRISAELKRRGFRYLGRSPSIHTCRPAASSTTTPRPVFAAARCCKGIRPCAGAGTRRAERAKARRPQGEAEDEKSGRHRRVQPVPQRPRGPDRGAAPAAARRAWRW